MFEKWALEVRNYPAVGIAPPYLTPAMEQIDGCGLHVFPPLAIVKHECYDDH